MKTIVMTTLRVTTQLEATSVYVIQDIRAPELTAQVRVTSTIYNSAKISRAVFRKSRKMCLRIRRRLAMTITYWLYSVMSAAGVLGLFMN